MSIPDFRRSVSLSPSGLLNRCDETICTAVLKGLRRSRTHSAVAIASPASRKLPTAMRTKPVSVFLRSASNQHEGESATRLKRLSTCSCHISAHSSDTPSTRAFGLALRLNWEPTMESRWIATAPWAMPLFCTASWVRASAMSLSAATMADGDMTAGCQLSSVWDRRSAPSNPPPAICVGPACSRVFTVMSFIRR